MVRLAHLTRRAFHNARSLCDHHHDVISPAARLLSAATRNASSASAAAAQSAAAFDTQYHYTRDRSRLIYRTREKMVPYAVSPFRAIPPHLQIAKPSYAATGRVMPSLHPERILIHGTSSIERMTAAARLARRMLDYACDLARPGVTTDAIDDAVHHAILRAGAYPSPLNYAGFPKSLCTSVNEVICHGIPDARELRRGDVVSFDVSCFIGGVHGDNCATVIVGDWDDDDGDGEDGVKNGDGAAARLGCGDSGTGGRVDWRGVRQRTKFASDDEEELFVTARRLVQAAKESLDEAVSVCRPGGCLTEVGEAVHAVADAYGYDTVQKYRGHGIGEEFHCAPFVKHYRNSEWLELVPGMIFTIEPMITEGRADCVEWDDDWTVVTMDGGRAAQFEHTVLITEKGVDVLTMPE